jgi:Zn-dependent protease
MRGSWRLGAFAGIGIFVHWTFLLLIAFVVFVHLSEGHSFLRTLEGIGFILALFACVVLHEFGHALTGQRFGVRTRDITLLPIGGVARFERLPERPLHEFLVAIAGPLVNVVIAGILFAAIWATGSVDQALPFSGAEKTFTERLEGSFLVRLMWVNIILVAFNMLPGFPMDGGRVLRAILATSLPYARATRIAAGVGQFTAVAFGLLGLLVFNPILILIAVFVFLGAQQEGQEVAMRALIRGVRVGDAMVTRFRTLERSSTLREAVDELLAGSQQDFPVLDGEEVVGLLTRDDIVRALNEAGPDASVERFMSAGCPRADEGDMLEEVIPGLREQGCSSAAVIRDGRVTGLLTMENLSELVMVTTALGASRAKGTIHEIQRSG